MKFIGTGLSGLVGSRIVELLTQHTFTNYSLENGVDITDKASITQRIQQEPDVQWILHLAAYTNVQQAEADRNLGEQSAAWKVNVEATQHIVDVCKATGKHLLYVDTDYAFDGTKDSYTEDDVPHPEGWYAITKSEGAKRALTLGSSGVVIRIANPYRAHPVGKNDFVHKMIDRLVSHQGITAPNDQLFVPTFVDDIAIAVEKLIALNASGIFHVVGSQALSPYEAARAIARAYSFDAEQIQSTSFASYFEGKAPVPQKAALLNEKIRALGIVMHGFDDGIIEMKRQEEMA